MNPDGTIDTNTPGESCVPVRINKKDNAGQNYFISTNTLSGE